MIRFAMGLLLAVACTQAMAVNKCTGADGKVVFQDAPCEGRGEPVKVWPSGPSPSSVSGPDDALQRARRQAELEGIHQRADIRAAIERGEPAVGMSRSQLEQALGAPDAVNADQQGGLRTEQLIFDRPGQSWYVITENGVVVSIQYRPSAKRERLGRAGRCPTPQEIRSMETSASSITLSERERLERLRQIGEARRCSR